MIFALNSMRDGLLGENALVAYVAACAPHGVDASTTPPCAHQNGAIFETVSAHENWKPQ
ncbi:MAG: hypothetical protein ACJA09_001824 [Alcanivorax sp.]|jgi:hypothetical protein